MPTPNANEQTALDVARRAVEHVPHVDVDEDARFSEAHDAIWVSAWLRVPKEAIADEKRRRAT